MEYVLNSENKKIFISSTVFDLIDVRAEIEDFIRDIGFTPVMSDSKNDGFVISTDTHSIETCLTNVRNSDALILILSQRYGPSLETYGYDKVSATHLEYIEATKNNIPIFFFIRDRLESEYLGWKKNGRTDSYQTQWVKDKAIFSLIHSHTSNIKDGKNNWYQTFSSSIELKRLVKKDFGADISKRKLTQKIENNNVPIFQVEGEIIDKGFHQNHDWYFMNLRGFNNGMHPAYDVEVKDKTGTIHNVVVVPINGNFIINIKIPKSKEFTKDFIISYTDGIGVAFEDTFKFQGNYNGRAVSFDISLQDRIYKLVDCKINIQ